MPVDDDKTPLPAKFLEPWLRDNGEFIDREIAQRREALDQLRERRPEFQNRIRRVELCEPRAMAAVDAAVATVPFGDLVHILVQAVLATDNGEPTFGPVVRITGVAGHEMSQLATPLRVVEECAILAGAVQLTIADTSFWSVLMEVNQAITLNQHHSIPCLANAVTRLTEGGLFIKTINNMNVIAMSKKGEARTLARNVSDREAWGRILEAGGYTEPQSISQALDGRFGMSGGRDFGIERRGFTAEEVKEIRDLYEKWIGVIYYKPHVWSRAYRIEAHMEILNSSRQLMPILSAIHIQTLVRSIIEPWPQFVADHTAKQIRHIASLYGSMNYHRSPFEQSRTGTNERRR